MMAILSTIDFTLTVKSVAVSKDGMSLNSEGSSSGMVTLNMNPTALDMSKSSTVPFVIML